jgi:glycosyltransferase involved in cell wall biosynthesis
MKICMLVYAFYESDTRVLQYAKLLAARGNIVDVIALQREGAPEIEVLDGVNVHRIQKRNVNEKSRFAYLFRMMRFLLVSAAFLAKRQFSQRYDVIHIHSVPDFLVFAAAIPKILGAKIILDIHDILPEFYASKFGVSRDSWVFKAMVGIERVSVLFSDHVIIANHLWRNRLISRSVRAEKCSVFLNYPDPAVFRRNTAMPTNGKFLILYPGTLNVHQGVDVALRAFAQIASELPDAEFQVFGEGPAKPELMRLRDELGLSSRVQFHSFLPVCKIVKIMSTAHLAIVPKRASSEFGNEAASTKIMEFMALGVPIIASRTKIDTYYHNDSRIRFFESENEADLARAIIELHNDPQLRAKLATNASVYVEQNNWKQEGQEYLKLVTSLASKGLSHEAQTPNTTTLKLGRS